MKRKILFNLAEQGLFSETETSTKKLAKKLGLSQQSVSRILIELEKEGMIKRHSSPDGITVRLRKEGINSLKDDFLKLKKIFQPQKSIKGRVVAGFGEGKYYVGKYRAKIKEVLGFTPFLGTLNIRTKAEKVRFFLLDLEPSRIKDFHDRTRSFGAIDLYRIKINGIQGALLRPERNHHEEDVIEIISENDLRKKLRLGQKSTVEITK